MELWIPVLVAAAAWIPAVLLYLNRRVEVKGAYRSLEADVSNRITEACGRLADTYMSALSELESASKRRAGETKEQIEVLEARVGELETELTLERKSTKQLRSEMKKLRGGIERLVEQIRKLGMVPVWEPDSDFEENT